MNNTFAFACTFAVFSLIEEYVNMLHKKKRSTFAACTCTHGILNVVDEILKAGADISLSKT